MEEKNNNVLIEENKIEDNTENKKDKDKLVKEFLETLKFNTIKHVGNKTINPYGVKYKKKKKKKDKISKKSRKINRK